jgi:hypothetical protein
MTALFTVYFIGTRNIAADRIAARSARSAVALASAMTGTPAHYLAALKVTP